MGLKVLLDRVGGEGRVQRCVGGLVAHDDGLAVIPRSSIKVRNVNGRSGVAAMP